MRWLSILALAVVTIFSGYWLVAAATLERGIVGWIDARAAEGWVANYESSTVEGFPRVFRTTVNALELADPATGVAWTAPEFTLIAGATSPNRIQAIWPERQSLASPVDRIDIAAAQMTGEIAFDPGTRLALSDSDIVLRDVRLTSDRTGESTHLENGRFVLLRAEDTANRYALDFAATGVTPPEPVRRQLDPAGLLPEVIEGLTVDADVSFDAPWDRFALERERPQITALSLTDLRASWGEVELRAAGDLTVAAGVPEGRITVKATSWREMIGIAVNTGVLPEAIAPTVENLLEALAGLSGPPETLDAPLTFRNGRVSFGPIPLGPAPNLTLR